MSEDDWEWKGGYDRASWVGRYMEQMMRYAGMEPYEAECHAVNAFEASDEDCDPDETAEADIAYMAGE